MTKVESDPINEPVNQSVNESVNEPIDQNNNQDEEKRRKSFKLRPKVFTVQDSMLRLVSN